MREMLPLLRAIYENKELREAAIHYSDDELSDNRFPEVLHIVSDYFAEKNIFELVFPYRKECTVRVLPRNFEEVKEAIEHFSKEKNIALFACMLGHVSSVARMSDEYIFFPWMIGEGVLIPIFEAVLSQ